MALPPDRLTLSALLAEVQGARLVRGDASTVVRGVTNDSRRVSPGDLFVAVPGFERDGREFVPDALARGAAAIVVEGQPDVESSHEVTAMTGARPVVVVPRARVALADFAAAIYGHPSRQFPVVGITGTDGKTSTTHLVSAILERRGLKTGWLTTVNTRIGDDIRPNAADNTTPEAPIVQRALAEMRADGVQVAILETSSHALTLDRVRGVHYQVGIFTNLSPEHINFHGSFEAYRAAKRMLFERLPAEGLAVLNADDESCAFMREATPAAVVTYGLERAADVSAHDIRLTPGGATFVVEPGGATVHSQLIGRFNVSNWLAAYAAARHFGASLEDFQRAATAQPPVPGRMNLVRQGQPFAVVIDFAHTPQALEKALDTVRSLVSGRVLLAFGLAGGRDAGNRPVMGALAARKADFFIITTDDPGHEQPGAIAEEIVAGARPVGGHFAVELDRRAAIRTLLERAQPGDAVVLAGKGHEDRMVVGSEKLPWNDACAAASILGELGYASKAVP